MKTRRELLERLLAAAHLADRVDDAVVDGQDRLDVEQGAGERLGAADAAALLEVLERGDREDDAVLLLEPLDQRLDLLVGRAPREPALDREREEPDRERRGLGVDDVDPVASDLGGRGDGRLVRAGELRRQLQRVDPLVAGELLVDVEEVLRRRLRRRRQRRRAP